MTSPIVVIALFGLFIVIMGAVFVWGAVRRYRHAMGLDKEKREKTENVGFIINAFHEVTKKLKDKEKELEQLKSLAEQRAENVETYNENILQCVPSGVITFDYEGRVTTFNRSAEEILDIPREQALGRVCQDIFNDSEMCQLIHGTLQKKRSSTRKEMAISLKGEQVWLGFNTVLLRERNGTTLGVILSFSDLTEVKRLQEQIELRERLTALGEMSAGIAHELRNPMAVISGYMNLLSKKGDAKAKEIIQDVGHEISGMNRIIDDLLTFARPASLNPVPVSIRDLIDGCLASVIQARERDARLTTGVHVDDIEISLDDGLMRQAFCNLIQNAAEAMPDGGRLSIEAHAGKDVKVMFKDTGCGIPEEKLKKIFLPFFTTKDRGVGLGLALVHKIVLSHGGRVEAESTEGTGTTITVILPKG